MKKKSMKLLLLFALIFTTAATVSAQVYVRVRPVFPITVRPAQPSHQHVWIEEDWQPYGHSYRYTGGRWAAPPHHHYVRRSGRWEHNEHGDRWIPGEWRKP